MSPESYILGRAELRASVSLNKSVTVGKVHELVRILCSDSGSTPDALEMKGGWN